MKDSADIRKLNKYKIKKILWKGGDYTKQQISVNTGLSIATCNTLLNEMEEANEVIGKKKRLQDVGRESVCYQINENFETVLCVHFDLANGEKNLTLTLLSAIGTIIKRAEKKYKVLDYTTIADEIQNVCEHYKNISQIIIGTPSIAENGVIQHCDISELENVKIVEKIQCQFSIPVYLENDMHLKAYGYYKKCGNQEQIVTLANFPAHVLPGTASVHAGMILKGKNQFAGMVGFLPYGMERQEQISLLKKSTCRPFIVKSIASIIAIINPGVIVLTGDLLCQDSLEWVKKDCLAYIPEEYIPDFVYEQNLDSFYLEGMYQKALDLKGVFQ